ncbi:MAG: hypothetical protein DRP85_07570 [Candidatus Makaraimicrobium thalassicum]|nr:MAG: hypothetical protein DRP85_07570 [Candidatus Omnitrophota bacterium]
MGKRYDELEKRLTELNVIVEGSESRFWGILREMIQKTKDEAINAFHTVNIDNVDNPELLRHFISQRVKAKVCSDILNIVENAKISKGLVEAELNKIKAAEKP